MNYTAQDHVGAAEPATASNQALLNVSDLTVRFGGITALSGISFSIQQGGIVGLIGPNGAGKTTLFNCLSRLYMPSSGAITLHGRPLLHARRHQIATLGVARTFQNCALFDKMTAIDNILVGGHVNGSNGFVSHVFRLSKVKTDEATLRERANQLASFMNLTQHADALVGGLPFPIRKRVELARALMMEPKLLLLDEPAAGLNHEEVELLKDQILAIRDRFKVTILLVEHHMNLVMSISDRIIAINFGKKIADGTPDEVRREAAVIEAYLGAAA